MMLEVQFGVDLLERSLNPNGLTMIVRYKQEKKIKKKRNLYVKKSHFLLLLSLKET